MTLTKLARGVLAVFSLLLVTNVALAQTRTITGKVTDSKGDAVPSATVAVKGSKNSTTTASDGSFRLSVPTGANTLVISSVGFTTMEVSISGKDDVSVSLETNNAALNEVVVIGYGTRKVKDLTGSVANITPKDFNKGQISTPDQLLQGRTPGVLVTPSSGQPGAAATINIRGTASIRGNQEPLYVIDGVPISGGGTVGSASGVEGSSTPLNPLMFINPNDIESMVILKDASAAAIYGARGANGVILITTKTGKGGKKGQFTFGANTSIATTAKRYDLLGPSEFLAAARQANIDGGSDPAAAAIAVQALDGGANTDWQDEIFRTAFSQNFNLGYGFNTKTTNVRLSGSYDNQEGIVRNSSLKRATIRANASQKFLNDKLKFDLATTFSNSRNEYPPLSNNAGFQGSLLGAALQFNPTYPVKNANGSFFQPGDQRNPSQMLAYFEDKDNINRFLTSLTGTYQITKGLSYKVVFGYDMLNTERTSFSDPRLSANAYGGTVFYSVPNGPSENLNNPIFGNGRTTRQINELRSTLLEQYVTWDRDFQKHSFNIVGGYSYQSFQNDYSQKVGWGLNTPVVNPGDVFVKNFDNFKNYRDLFPGFDKNELQSFFGRVNYSFDNKYFLTATVRVDGSSKFGANNRYGTFPAFAAKWKLSNEKFAERSIAKWFNEFSLRANYGIIGSQDGLASYGAVRLGFAYPAFGTNPAGNAFQQDENKDLKWEQAATTGFGLDFTTRNSRLSGTVDYFYTERKNLLVLDYVPGGFSATARLFANLPGIVVNKGWEFSLSYKILQGRKFNWEVSGNLTKISNEYRDLPNPIITGAVSGQGLTGAYAQTFVAGQPLFTWSMPVFQGFDGNGNARYEKGAANQLAGTALPNMFAGLTNNFNMGNWNLSVFLNAVTGFKVYDNTSNALFLKGSLRNGRNVTSTVANSNENPFNPGSVSTRFLHNGDFIRLANVNLSYTFNLDSKVIRSLSVFASGQNLALFTKYPGLDPEVNVDKQIAGVPSRGFDYTQYPRPRVVTVGVNLAF